MAGEREVYFEMARIGAYLKVTAIDSVTGVEVSVVGPATGSQAQLRATALKKLNYVLSKRAAAGKGGSLLV